MRNLFAGRAFQPFGGAKPLSGQGVGGPVPVQGASPMGGPVSGAGTGAGGRGKAVPVSKPKAGPSAPGKSSFSGDCPVCH
jgi:hypothetical protein